MSRQIQSADWELVSNFGILVSGQTQNLANDNIPFFNKFALFCKKGTSFYMFLNRIRQSDNFSDGKWYTNLAGRNAQIWVVNSRTYIAVHSLKQGKTIFFMNSPGIPLLYVQKINIFAAKWKKNSFPLSPAL